MCGNLTLTFLHCSSPTFSLDKKDLEKALARSNSPSSVPRPLSARDTLSRLGSMQCVGVVCVCVCVCVCVRDRVSESGCMGVCVCVFACLRATIFVAVCDTVLCVCVHPS
jgi:hypothetical protein